MAAEFKQKTVLVTGAGGGIGKATAAAFAAEGADVVVADVDIDRATSAAKSIGGRALHLDVGDIEKISAAVEFCILPGRRIDVLVNNAAVFDMSPLLEVTPAGFERLFRINVDGMFFVMQAVARLMQQDGLGGAIVNMASQAGRQAEPFSSVYAATKAAVISLTRSAAVALIGSGIRVNAIAPGVIETEMWDKIDALYVAQHGASPGEKRRQVAAAVPYGRMGSPAEVAAAILFLASKQSEYIVGQTLNVDGGNILS
ncbi:glucose 1-dehydrogenase [Rhizobium leguminosarum]|uniref:glucose 1-dehydrogenase n=1 Tax=Rhizobium leguminosarum TaxID=384 RepID=UPI001C940858|nr:glucose 1-dehydrogenase [Rhizobium leguminosarum]MBY5406449.1 glucose 1-dehydrogenase [Rhizobium leguminosarum]